MLGIVWLEVTIDCRDTHRVAAFWGMLLDETPRDVGRPDWYRIGPVVEGGPAITFQPVPEPKTAKTRMHIDLRVGNLRTAIAEVEKLGAAGPSEVHYFDEGTVAVMGDPEGNEFCLVAL